MAQKFLNGIEISGNLTVDSHSAVGSTVFDVQGSQGQLFSITNSLSGDLFSVSDISGVPILNVNSSGSITLDGTIDSNLIMPTAGSQIRIGSFTDGGNNSGEYANDDLVIGDGSISIYPHRRGDYASNEASATSTTFRSKLNIWSDAEDHITFGGANTHMVTAWEEFKIWINNDSGSAGTLHLYNKTGKTEFARFSGDGTSSFINGKFFVNGELEATNLDINGTATFDTNVNSGGFVTQKNANAGNQAYTSRVWQSDTGQAEIWRNSSTRTQTGGAAQSFNIYNNQTTNIWSGGTRALHLDTSQNATFAANVTIGSVDSTTTGLNIGNASPTIQLFDTTNDAKLLIYTQDSSSIIGTYSSHPLFFFTDSTQAFELDTSQNAIFAGNVTTDGIYMMSTAPDGNVFQLDQSGRSMDIGVYFASNSTGSEWQFKTSTGNVDGSTTNALVVKPLLGTFAGTVAWSGGGSANANTAYTHSQAAHAPSNAEQNVQSDWNATSGDAQILNKLTRQFETHYWGDDRFVRTVTGAGVGGADTGDKWVHLSNVDISGGYEKIKIDFCINSRDDNSNGQEKITVLYENHSSAQENHQLRWYAGDMFPDTFKAVKSIRSASSGLSNTYDLYVQISAAWKDTFTVHAEYWKNNTSSTSITYPTTVGSATTPTAGSDDKSLTSRQRWVDADTLDGINSSQFLRSDANDAYSGVLQSDKNIVSNANYNIIGINSTRATNDYGGLSKKYAELNLQTPGPNTDGSSSAHGLGHLSIKLADNASNSDLVQKALLRHDGELILGGFYPQTGETELAGLTIRSRYSNTTNRNFIRFQTDHSSATTEWTMAKIIANDGGNFNGTLTFQVATGSNNSSAYDSGHDAQLETAMFINDTKDVTFKKNIYLDTANPYIQSTGSGQLRIKHTSGQTMYLRPDETGALSIFEGANSQSVYMMTQTPSVNSTANESAKLVFQTRSKQSDGQNNSKSATIKHLTHNIGNNHTNLDFAGSDKARFNMPIEAHGGLYFTGDTHMGFIPHPRGAQYRSDSSSDTGYILIKFPTDIGGQPDDMVSFYVDIFDYTTNEMISVFIGGYIYTNATGASNYWYNCTAIINTKQAAKDFNVRFGYNSTGSCYYVAIGETTSVWAHPSIVVRDFQCSYRGNVEHYIDSWTITTETTTLSGVDETQSGNLPQARPVAWGDITSKPYIETSAVTSATTTTTVATISGTTYAAVFFDYVIFKSSNIRAGTVVACSDGTNVSFTETSTTDLGDTSDVTLAVDLSSANFRLRATTTSSTWNIKALTRAI